MTHKFRINIFANDVALADRQTYLCIYYGPSIHCECIGNFHIALNQKGVPINHHLTAGCTRPALNAIRL